MIYFKRPCVFLNCLFQKEIKNIIVYVVKYSQFLVRKIKLYKVK